MASAAFKYVPQTAATTFDLCVLYCIHPSSMSAGSTANLQEMNRTQVFILKLDALLHIIIF